ncbi:chryseobasin-related MNIO class RiPP peptide [Pontibacter chinhatensis]|uniref:Uncharacterized protein n=1 Tax=Pontibacter chinhatensis TaxID=1436961 RepID=A0A1I2Z3X3_9BACT|nr:hypothetical protein [Pontibacter chinhatensis]SFH32572.1 hypothetical protein SAMN05421739_11154 [Pontibacter chinhatensis]
MKLPKTLLSAIVVGIAVQTSACQKDDLPKPTAENGGKDGKEVIKTPYDNCPACGMG